MAALCCDDRIDVAAEAAVLDALRRRRSSVSAPFSASCQRICRPCLLRCRQSKLYTFLSTSGCARNFIQYTLAPVEVSVPSCSLQRVDSLCDVLDYVPQNGTDSVSRQRCVDFPVFHTKSAIRHMRWSWYDSGLPLATCPTYELLGLSELRSEHGKTRIHM